jgi:hypothetical protein
MLEFENIKELKQIIHDSKEKQVRTLSVFSSVSRMIVFLVLYAVVMVVTTLIVYSVLNKAARIVRVPSVINKDFVEGYMLMRKINLDVNVSLQNYPDVAKGVIVSQSIPPAALVKEHRKIVLTVSQGRDTMEIATNTGQASAIRSIFVVFRVPQNIGSLMGLSDPEAQVTVTIYVSDEGEYKDSVVYNQKARAGDTVRVPLQVIGKVKERILVNDEPFQEKEVE